MRWVFDELPPSGARRGGDPSSHAFRHDLETFVREVVQNANDQAVSWPEVRFGFVELRDAAYDQFCEAVAWPSLVPHLEGVAATPHGEALAGFLEATRAQRRLLLLRVEDRNTEGLTGAEASGESHFRSLAKDTLYSHKATEAAGGSYGLGKSVLWAFSGLSTVLFNSVLLTHLDGQRSPRLIGRVELPSHAVKDHSKMKWFSGSGWFGRPVRKGRGERAESVWADEAQAQAERLHLAREDRPGTSIVIVGFRDPTSERQDQVDDLLARIGQATLRSFWPAMMMNMRRLKVRLAREGRDERVDVGAAGVVQPFVDAYRARDETVDELTQPGQVARRTIRIELPARRDGEGARYGHAELLVRLAPEGRSDALRGRVALVRGPGMVVRYWDRRRLATGMRGFHAVLLCGVACNPKAPTAEDLAMERFLRAAEPPGHDQWQSTPKLKQQYQRGYAKALKRLEDRVDAELRALLIARPTQGTEGPERLQRRFPLGKRGGKAPGDDAPFRFRGMQARFEGTHWSFEGTIEPKRPRVPWRARLSLHALADDGTRLDTIAISAIDSTDEATLEVGDGIAAINAPASTRAVAFAGRSASRPEWKHRAPGELGFDVTGTLDVGGDT